MLKLRQLKETPLPCWVAFLLALSALIGVCAETAREWGINALARGQVVKQFFAYSISEWIARHPAEWLTTHLPCLDTTQGTLRAWAEEPPLFHFLSAWGIRLFPEVTAPVSILALGLIFLATFRFVAERWIPEDTDERGTRREMLHSAGLAAAVAVCVSPVVFRYSVQHMPDLLATAFLILGAVVSLPAASFIFFTLSVTTKALTIIPIAAILVSRWDIWDRKFDFKKAAIPAIRTALVLIAIALPFLFWIFLLWKNQIPNPFSLGNGVENRHSGSLGLLIDPRYWARFFTWTFVKGVGLIALPFFIVRILGEFKIGPAKKRVEGFTAEQRRKRRLLLFWMAAIIPYWLLIRQANFVHDYYSLPFVFPILIHAISGVLLLPRPKSTVAQAAIVCLLFFGHLYIGGRSLLTMEPVSFDPAHGRPLFCQMES